MPPPRSPAASTAAAVGTLLPLLLLLLPSPTQAVSLDVPPRDKVCLYQYYEAGHTGKAEVFVVNGGNLDIGVSVEGPFVDDVDGAPSKTTQETKVVYQAVVASSSAFLNQEHPPGITASADGLEITWSAKPGAYALCLDNTMSQMQTKLVEFSFPAPLNKGGKGEGEEDDFDLEAALAETNGGGGNGTIPENIKQSYKADLALLKHSAERIGRTLGDVQQKQQKERHRLALQTAANQNNHHKMVVSSLFETVVFIGVSLFQLFWVRRWFEGRGLRAPSRSRERV